MTPTEQRLYRENAELKADLDAALAELRARADQDRVTALRLAWSLTRGESEMLGALLRANGRVVGRELIDDLLEECGRPRTGECRRRVGDVLVLKLRRKMPEGSIETVRGCGLRLTKIGLEACASVLKPVAEDIGETIVSIAVAA